MSKGEVMSPGIYDRILGLGEHKEAQDRHWEMMKSKKFRYSFVFGIREARAPRHKESGDGYWKPNVQNE